MYIICIEVFNTSHKKSIIVFYNVIIVFGSYKKHIVYEYNLWFFLLLTMSTNVYEYSLH